MASPAPRSAACVLGQQITVRGTLTGEEDLVVEGRVEGSVSLAGHLIVAMPGHNVLRPAHLGHAQQKDRTGRDQRKHAELRRTQKPGGKDEDDELTGLADDTLGYGPETTADCPFCRAGRRFVLGHAPTPKHGRNEGV